MAAKTRTEPCVGCGKRVQRLNKEWPSTSGWAEAKCRACRLADPRPRRAATLAAVYGITPGQWQEMWDAQDGKCGICSRSLARRRPCVDHDHSCCPGRRSCGRCIRGLLCTRCNSEQERAWLFAEARAAWRRRAWRQVVIYDLDSTLANTRQRWHLSPMADKQSSWEAYSGACELDTPLAGTRARIQLDHNERLVHICSGRSFSSFDATSRWLAGHSIPYDALSLRAAADFRTNGQLKVDYINQLRTDGYDPVLFYEDWPEAARQIFEETGVPVLGINPFYAEDDARVRQPSDGLGGGL